MNGGDKFKPMANLGDILPMDRGQQAAATHFICCLYGDSKCESLNDLRCEKADKVIAAKKLPLTEDSFVLHLLSGTYQVYIGKHAHLAITTFHHQHSMRRDRMGY